MQHTTHKSKFKSLIFLFLFFLLMAGSTAAWLYLSEDDLPKKVPLRAKQVFLWHNNLNNAQTITGEKI